MANNKQNFLTKQETGYSDPLSDCADFNILNFINSSDAPDSPDLRFCNQNTNSYPMNGNGASVEQQQMQQRQPHPNANHMQHRQMQPVILDNGLLYTNGAARLPDSPPITDISAGASSGSPSSDSPYSPENYATMQHMHNNGNQMTLNMQVCNEAGMQHMSGNMRIQAHQTQVSPNSDFLSPYPAQTPGSHHSQVSPPAINQNNFMLDTQQNYPMETYLMSSDDFGEINIPDYNPPAIGQKRQRMSDGSASVKNEGYPGQRMMHQGSIGSMSESPHGGSLDDFDECNQQKTIRFGPFETRTWSTLYDQNQRELSPWKVNVVADKGFNYSASDNCFVNQKKNHFQITVLIKATNESPPCYVMSADRNLHEVTGFKLAFSGVKSEMVSSEIQIRQSQTDRKPIPHDPVQLNVAPLKLTKVTVPRLHFSETTLQNHRKNGRPNPDQKYFFLIVKLLAETPNGLVVVQSYASDKVIVRASNPGQFEPPENEVAWQRSANVLHCNGPVAIGTDKAINDAQLTVLGNIVSTGQHTRPSDRRVKTNILDMDTKDAMDRINNVRIVEFDYKPEMAQQWGLNEDNRHRVGVIAQELAQVIPDAVRDNGEFLTVDDARIFYDTVAAAQELYRLTGNLECKIDQVEKISEKLARYAQKRKQLGASMASGLSDLTVLLNANKKITDGISDDKNLDTKSSLSQSRFSLTSITPSTIDASSASQVGRSRRRHHGKYQDQSLCNSKITQMTMVSLVLIMSLCLITMCTLYVLDWYHRTYVYDQNQFPRHYPTMNPDEIGHYKEYTNWKPPLQVINPLLATCYAGGCTTYCCSSRQVYNSSSGTDESTSMFASLANPHSPIEIRPGSGDKPNSLMPLESGVEIRLVDLNINIDKRYCIDKSCVPRKGRYELYVPISPYFPTIPMHIQIRVEPGMFIDNCGHLSGFKHQACETLTVDNTYIGAPSVSKIDTNTFELNATGYTQSAFQFRVGYATNMCLMSEGQQGKSFDEYSLFFYRTCVA